jgi:hypothetical protein
MSEILDAYRTRPCSGERVAQPQELAVSQYGLQWRHVGIGAQNEDAIKARLLSGLTGIDFKNTLTPPPAALAQIALVGGVADRGFLTAP